jgi:hypothetical protein
MVLDFLVADGLSSSSFCLSFSILIKYRISYTISVTNINLLIIHQGIRESGSLVL